MFTNKTSPSRLRVWTVTNLSFTILVLAVCLLEVLSIYLKTGETITWVGVTLSDAVWVVALWWIGNLILYAISFHLVMSGKHLTYFNKTGRWRWITIVLMTLVVNRIVEEPSISPVIATELILHAFTKMGLFALLYPLIDALLDGFANPGDKGKIRDHYFISHIKNTTAWRRWVLHAGRLQWDLSLIGPRYPEFMLTLDPDGEEQFHIWVHCGLCGFAFSSARLPYLSHELFKGHYRLGFYTCETHLCFSLMDNEDFRGWQGGRSFIFHWENILKGKETVDVTDEVWRGCFQLPTIPHEGYPDETLSLQVTSRILKRKYSRWFTPPELEQYHVYTQEENVAPVAGKGENGWDCEDETGIDLWLASRPITELTPRMAARLAIDYIEQSRSRR